MTKEAATLGHRHKAAYGGWRRAEAMLEQGHARHEVVAVLRRAYVDADQHVPLRGAVESLARVARSSWSPPATSLAPCVRRTGRRDR